MLDPRIYRTSLMLVVLAVFVLAFSLDDQQGPLGTTLAPDAFNAQNAYTTMQKLAAEYPQREPGSANDEALASYVGQALHANGFVTSRSTFRAHTVEGTRTLETVTGIRPGEVSGSVVVVAHRDAARAPSTAELSGTAVMLELARVLAGETQHRSIVLVSTSGSLGAAGATQLARTIATPVDAVIVLGDLAGTHVQDPIVVPWSDGRAIAPTMLRNTLGASLSSQAGIRPGGTSIASQLAHLAFPLTVTEQGPFGLYGESAALLSVSGERTPAADEPTDPATISTLGRTVVTTVNALDGGRSVPAPSAYLLFDGKVIPAWAIRVFVLALILPVVAATIDGLARARRRGSSIVRWVIWVLTSALPFALGLLVVLGAKHVGLIDIAPPGPVGAGVVPLQGSGAVVLGLVACAIAIGFALRPLLIRLLGAEAPSRHRVGEPVSPGAGAALLLVLCAVTLAIWWSNPVAAGLMVIALHLWMWVVDPQVRLSRGAIVAFLILGVAPGVLVVVYYAYKLALGPLGLAWNGALLLAGGQLSIAAALEWSVALGCVISLVAIAARGTRERRPEEVPVTVRGPVTYAGPGSLGGTESALRRARQ